MKNTLLIFLFFSLNACFMPHSQDPNNTSNFQYTNALINETSPYLLQHAHNPVNWMPWDEKSLQKAKEEDKPLLISIGYSACHWCHVMEHESFEDSTVADLMNKHFICIKVDREERPDVDQVYMNAVQLMTGRGGWPLNCFATPDGRPFYGGTYFQKEQWMSVLQQISNVYANERSKVEDYANQLTEGVKNSELIVKSSGNLPFSIDSLADGLSRWKSVFDTTFGGNDQAPKFPIPNNYQFLLNYYYHTKDEQLKAHLDLSLEKMAYGGIYDQIGGGFARYSTDMQWKVPHFEKMLYDNAQLLSLYAEAYRLNPKPLYERIIRETIGFIKEELYHEKGAFYSALDADSEGEEGKFYVWTKEELKNILADDFKVVEQLYNINSFGFWEKDNYVLIRNKSNAALSETLNLKESELEEKIKSINRRLKEHREKRMKPGLDDKSLTSWNALTIKGLVDSYLSLGETAFLDLALQNANFLLTVQHKKDGSLWHSYKDGKSTINGYLEDYSFTAEAFIALYEATLDEKWLRAARQLVEYCKVHFYDAKSGMFFFTSDEDPHLIARKTEVQDNVIPASNSTLAKVLFKLSLYFENPEYEQLSKQMLRNMLHQFDTYLPSYTNWGILLLNQAFPYYEIAVVGPNATDVILELHQHYLPNKLLIGSKKEQTSLVLLENKWVHEQTTIYVCENKVCQLPVTAVSDALKQIKP